ncbi:aldose 1-epimerase family protein [Corynebacterium mendelii]|uniref:Aldose 1-epimerase family protein n=1 Tax=Corynebacterium mendelii TaxID=2765362 RepID=A0A939IXN7_9CORY|nr:aldose 1-epimerase family protein [Corynebacterium mendelii]MBN9644660.1 aldose 1-epimerase family protein [Corynebacterium mendelii]
MVDNGHEVLLTAGDYAAAINLTGGGPRMVTYQGRNLTETYPAGTTPPLSAGQLLLPWPNRIGDGVFDFRGTRHRLTINEPDANNAIHGAVTGQVFTVAESTADSCLLEAAVDDPALWPFRLDVAVAYRLDADKGLSSQITVTNSDGTPQPFGCGVHTYLNAQDADLDDCVLTVTATKRLPLDPKRCLPCGPLVDVTGDDETYRLDGVEMKGRWFDFPYTGLTGGETFVHTLVDGNGRGVKLETDKQFGWVQVYTADPACDQAYPGRGRAVAVEPMTCPPEAFRSGTDVIVLDPGASFTGSWSMTAIG